MSSNDETGATAGGDGVSPVVLVTGAGGGIGSAIALAFARRGWRVYATDVVTPLPERVQERCETAELDVTDEEQCRAVVDRVVGEAGRLDCLVNNAGYAEAGPVEDVPVDAVRAEFEVLVHGPHALARAVLPHMRGRNRGRIVTVSSVLGLSFSPGLGAYAAGKAAVESLHDALRVELRGTGVDVALVEPAWVATDFGDAARRRLAGRERTPAYARTYAGLDDGWILDGNPLAAEPETVAGAVVRAATADDPKARYPVGRFARFVRWTHWLPAPVVDSIQAAYSRVTAAIGRWTR
ncbi:SDR family oxidoreductase [Halosimplex salinum]|uniref:SDR family oxidoreductase n=1 Tax=Halosimplex salinum TaxID=1710538 RepID=UPI000F4A9FD0|nr:SDR family oxidoreductase [Halosimplex salinum]